MNVQMNEQDFFTVHTIDRFLLMAQKANEK